MFGREYSTQIVCLKAILKVNGIISIFLSLFCRDTKILDRELGYWADQIPVTNAALCAVIDPLRGHRWHSLRCGGPEVAAFLCELEGK